MADEGAISDERATDPESTIAQERLEDLHRLALKILNEDRRWQAAWQAIATEVWPNEVQDAVAILREVQEDEMDVLEERVLTAWAEYFYQHQVAEMQEPSEA